MIKLYDSVHVANTGTWTVPGPVSEQMALLGLDPCLQRAHRVEDARTVSWGDDPVQRIMPGH